MRLGGCGWEWRWGWGWSGVEWSGVGEGRRRVVVGVGWCGFLLWCQVAVSLTVSALSFHVITRVSLLLVVVCCCVLWCVVMCCDVL